MQVGRTAIPQYSDITQDHNRIHFDPDFAARTPVGGIVAHGMLSASLVRQSLEATFGIEGMAGTNIDIRFVRPVRENDLVIAGGTRIGADAAYDIWIRAEGGGRPKAVITGTASIGADIHVATSTQR